MIRLVYCLVLFGVATAFGDNSQTFSALVDAAGYHPTGAVVHEAGNAESGKELQLQLYDDQYYNIDWTLKTNLRSDGTIDVTDTKRDYPGHPIVSFEGRGAGFIASISPRASGSSLNVSTWVRPRNPKYNAYRDLTCVLQSTGEVLTLPHYDWGKFVTLPGTSEKYYIQIQQEGGGPFAVVLVDRGPNKYFDQFYQVEAASEPTYLKVTFHGGKIEWSNRPTQVVTCTR
jgi:hypothetical protein